MQDTNINSKLYKGYESRNGTDYIKTFFNETPLDVEDVLFFPEGVAA